MAGRVWKRGETYHIAFNYKEVEYRKSALTHKKRDAEQLLAFYLGQCARKEFKGFSRDEDYTLFELLQDFEDDYEQRGMRDLRTVRYRSKMVRELFGDIPVSQITERQIDVGIKASLKAGKSRTTVNRYMQLLKQAMQLAKRKKLLAEVPHIPRFREDNARQGFFEREEFERIVSLLPDHLQDLTRFAYLTGWRKNEILTLEWRYIYEDVIRLPPERSKNKDGRVLVMVGEIAEIIERRRATRFDLCPYVFHREGQAIKNFDRAWDSARKRAGLPSKLFHDSRRTAVRNMDRAGVPREVAKRISGHKTDLIYSRYRIVNEEDIREGLLRAQAYMASQQSHILPFVPKSDTRRTQ